MEILILDIWLEKIRRGWKIEDAPSEAIREALRTYNGHTRQIDLKRDLSGKKGLVDL